MTRGLRFRVCDAVDLKRARVPYVIECLVRATADTRVRIDCELRVAAYEAAVGLYDRYRIAGELAAYREAVFERAHWQGEHGPGPLTRAEAATLAGLDSAVARAERRHECALNRRGSRVALASAKEFRARLLEQPVDRSQKQHEPRRRRAA